MANIDNNYLMENREQQILSEMTSLIESIKSQLAVLEEKLAQITQTPVQEDYDMVPIDLEIVEDEAVVGVDEDLVEDVAEVDAPVEEPVEVEEPVDVEEQVEDEVEETVVSDEAVEVDDQVEGEESVDVEESVEVDDIPEDLFEDEEPSEETKVDEPVEVDDDLPFFEEEAVEEKVPVSPVAEEPKAESRQAVIDAMAAKQAWRTDMPGLAVKDIRSAISLNDRLIFINYLFNEDPMAFQDVLTRINASQSLDEVVGMLAETHPEWDFESEVVYRFMMAVRRKIR
jgi:hypothetical protein